MRRFRTYMLVGGMPRAVLGYLADRDFAAADTAKRVILDLYHDDMYKFGDGDQAKVASIFDNIAGQLAKKSKRFMLTSLDSQARWCDYESAFKWLDESMIINTCVNVTDPSVGLGLSVDVAQVKCYLADTGLLVTQAFAGREYLDNELYRALLFDKLDVNEGMIVENVIAQQFRMCGYPLYYYAKNDPHRAENNLEVDFVIRQKDRFNPIEVKSGKYNKHTSLDRFKDKFGKKVGRRYVLHTKDLSVTDDVVYLPIYMASCL